MACKGASCGGSGDKVINMFVFGAANVIKINNKLPFSCKDAVIYRYI